MSSLLLATFAAASERMWLPEQVPESASSWADKGLELDPQALSDPLAAPLGAIGSTRGGRVERAASERRNGPSLRLRPVWYDLLRGGTASRASPSPRTPTAPCGSPSGPCRATSRRTQTTLAGLARKAGEAPLDAPADQVSGARKGAESR